MLENEVGEMVMGKKEIAEELDVYFALGSIVEDTSSIPELQESQGLEVNAVVITKEKVLGKLKCLKVDKSSRPDGLHPRFLKEIAEETVDALMVIFQGSLESGRVPEDPDGKEECAGIGDSSEKVYKTDSRMKEEWLRTLNLYLIDFRRMRRNLIETYRILRGWDRVDKEK
eukprot:g27061.t1